ncbi:protein of unknown function [Taphrina deformans PYCC 5710]|uniref:Uncharacterized protein n=1 Tax=Taphrina deformans (strain PYCC 5710 / ATCC 11124 / CBS 356.35 / IMI 108563 / JCM 9778 / NBRC 8474) TaxID=1097556 RepID=R4XJV7_TAPDE|nr:protein of unknown function [Taphrina deformans PYCC 5710]|eukprot:CCG83628.1 protein of unknown function [Taphrina deformans PYCC 5710]
MSLWEAEVEKSKFSPDSLRRKPTALQAFFSKAKGKYSEPHSSPQYKFPPRPYQDYQQPMKNVPVMIAERPQRQAPIIQQYSVNRDKPRPPVQIAPAPRAVRTRRKPEAAPSRPEIFPEQQPMSRSAIDQIADLIIQKSQLEQDIKERELRYQYLLTESQNITKAMRTERDAAFEDLLILRETTKDPAIEEQRPPCTPKSRYSAEDIDAMFRPREDYYFKEQFRQLEAMIREFVLNAMKNQPGMVRMVDLNPSMEFYISKHNLRAFTVFGIRDVRCIVCRGFLMEFLLERVFRVFLFGMVQGAVFKEGFQALSAIDIGRGSKWAAGVAKVLIASSSDYNPEKAAIEVVAELKIYLGAFIHLDESNGLFEVILKAAEVARDCRLEIASFSLEMPSYGTVFNLDRMDASKPENGPVAVCYSPVVTKRGNRRGEQYEVGTILIKAKVWRESIFAELQNLTADPNDVLQEYE